MYAIIIIIPSVLVSWLFFPVNMNTKRRIVTAPRIIKSRLINEGIRIGEIAAVRPRTQKIFIMFAPITFPIAMSGSFLNAAVTAVVSSGREVPTATIVAEIRKFERPRLSAARMAFSTVILPPR